jgi:hypothetical protein
MNSPECAARTARRLRAEAAGMLDTRLGDPPPNRSALAERLNKPPAEARPFDVSIRARRHEECPPGHQSRARAAHRRRCQAPPRGEPLPRPQDLQGTPASR